MNKIDHDNKMANNFTPRPATHIQRPDSTQKLPSSSQRVFRFSLTSAKPKYNNNTISNNVHEVENPTQPKNPKPMLMLSNQTFSNIQSLANLQIVSPSGEIVASSPLTSTTQLKSPLNMNNQFPCPNTSSSKCRPIKILNFPSRTQKPENNLNNNSPMNIVKVQIPSPSFVKQESPLLNPTSSDSILVKVRPPSSRRNTTYTRPFLKVPAQGFAEDLASSGGTLSTRRSVPEYETKEPYNLIMKTNKKLSKYHEDNLAKMKQNDEDYDNTPSTVYKHKQMQSTMESSAFVGISPNLVSAKDTNKMGFQISRNDSDNNTSLHGNMLTSSQETIEKKDQLSDSIIESDPIKISRIKSQFFIKHIDSVHKSDCNRRNSGNEYEYQNPYSNHTSKNHYNGTPKHKIEDMNDNAQENFIKVDNQDFACSSQSKFKPNMIPACSDSECKKNAQRPMSSTNSPTHNFNHMPGHHKGYKTIDRLLEAKQKAEIYNDKMIKQFEFDKQNEEEEQNFLELFDVLNNHL